MRSYASDEGESPDSSTSGTIIHSVAGPEGVLGELPFPAGDQPRVVIEKREQDRLMCAGDFEPTVHRVPGPDLVDWRASGFRGGGER